MLKAKRYEKQIILLLIMLLPMVASADNAEADKAKIFEVNNPDKKLSPYTGMSREHWKQAAEYLLSTAFQYVDNIKDPLDLQIEIVPVPFEKISGTAPGEPSAAIRERVIAARRIQEERFRNERGIHCNAQMTPKLIAKYAVLDETSLAMLKTAMTRFDLSARAYDRILKVARTIANLDKSENIQFQHIAEAIGYRNLDRESWGT